MGNVQSHDQSALENYARPRSSHESCRDAHVAERGILRMMFVYSVSGAHECRC